MNAALPRHSDEAEISVLGAMFLEPEAADQAREMLSANDFWQPPHRTIFEAIARVRDGGHHPDVLAVREELSRCGELEKAGGSEYLARIIEIVPTAANIAYHARRVREDAQVRRLGAIGGWIVESSRNGVEASDFFAEAERRIFDVTSRRGRRESWVGDILERAMRAIDKQAADAIPTPWRDLSERLGGGLQPGELVTIAARTSVGKTAAALQLAREAANRKIPVLYVSLEMGEVPIVKRLLSTVAHIPILRLRSGVVRSKDEQEGLAAAKRILSDLPILLVDDLRTVAAIQSRGRRFASASESRVLIVVDYLQLVDAPGENRTQQVGAVSRGLKRLALEIDSPVVACCQLNREADRRAGHPQLSDLRESGDIESDSDVVLLLERPELGKVASEVPPADRGLVNVWIAKNRNGPTGLIELHFEPEVGSFTMREDRRR